MKKMIAISVSLGIGLLISCGGDDPKTTQLLLDVDFENTATLPTYWGGYTNDGSVDTVTSWNAQESSSATHSVKFLKKIADPDRYTYIAQSILNIPFGKDVTFTLKIKAENLTGGGLGIAIRTDTVANESFAAQFISSASTTPIVGTFDWTTFTVKLTGVKKNAVDLAVFVIYYPEATGTVYVDDASLTAK